MRAADGTWTLPVALAARTTSAECRALDGDRAAWDELFARYNRRVVVGLLAHGFRIDRAKELAQEAWLRLIEKQRAGRLDRIRLPALAISQALLIARDRGRSKAARAAHVPLDDAGEWLEDPSRLEDRVLSRSRLVRADEVLSECSPSAQKIFELIYEYPGIGHREVADRVGLSVQRVRQIICEVRKRLRAVVEESK